jgi:hypothetical protein
VGGEPIPPDSITINVNTWRAELPELTAEVLVAVTATDALGNVKTESQNVLVAENAIPLDIFFESPTNKTAQDVAVGTDAIQGDINVLLARGQTEAVEIFRDPETQKYPLTGLLPGKNTLTVTANAEDHVQTTAKVLLFVDQVNPVVLEIKPQPMAVEISFSEAVQGVDARTVVLKDSAGAAVTGVITHKDANTALFEPTMALAPNHTYRLELLGWSPSVPEAPETYIADLAGNPLLPNGAGHVWQFPLLLPAASEE